MLFNADRNLKNNLLQMYKKDAEEHVNKKQMERQRKINEEREYLHQVDKKENALEDRLRLEKIKKINENMGDYQKMVQYPPMRHKSRIADVKINNYGFNVSGGLSSNQRTLNYNQSHSQSQSNSFNQIDRFSSMRTNPPREIDMFKREDNMGNYLTDKVNEEELKTYFQNQKNEKVKYYKDLLDTQCSQRKFTPPTNNNRVQNVNIINHQKRFNIANNPYNINRNDDFGSSRLDHNPILNPVNNLEYNKYLLYPKNMNEQDQGKAQTDNNIRMRNYNMKSNYEQYQPRQDKFESSKINDYDSQYQHKQFSMNDYDKQYQSMDNHQQRFQAPQQCDYQDKDRENRSIPYKFNDNIKTELQSNRGNYYKNDHIPSQTGQRLMNAGASSILQ